MSQNNFLPFSISSIIFGIMQMITRYRYRSEPHFEFKCIKTLQWKNWAFYQQVYQWFTIPCHTAPELIIQGPGVLPKQGGNKSIYKRDKKNWAVGNRVKGGKAMMPS
jgi:hypothetical protein